MKNHSKYLEQGDMENLAFFSIASLNQSLPANVTKKPPSL